MSSMPRMPSAWMESTLHETVLMSSRAVVIAARKSSLTKGLPSAEVRKFGTRSSVGGSRLSASSALAAYATLAAFLKEAALTFPRRSLSSETYSIRRDSTACTTSGVSEIVCGALRTATAYFIAA